MPPTFYITGVRGGGDGELVRAMLVARSRGEAERAAAGSGESS